MLQTSQTHQINNILAPITTNISISIGATALRIPNVVAQITIIESICKYRIHCSSGSSHSCDKKKQRQPREKIAIYVASSCRIIASKRVLSLLDLASWLALSSVPVEKFHHNFINIMYLSAFPTPTTAYPYRSRWWSQRLCAVITTAFFTILIK